MIPLEISPNLDYAVGALAWSVGGLVLGFALGRLERDVAAIRRMMHRHHHVKRKVTGHDGT